MFANGSSAIFKVEWLFGAVIFLEMGVGVHDHLADGGYGLGVGLKVEETVPYDGGGGLDVPYDKAGAGESHVVLVLDAFTISDLSLLSAVEFGEGEWEGFAR